MKRTIAAIIAGSFAAASFASAEIDTNKAFSLRLYGLAVPFEWKESINGQELLKESGPLFGVGGELGLRLADPLWIEGRGELFMGDVDYDGAIMTYQGELIPYKSATKYVGMKIDGNIAFKLPVARDFYLKPYAGFGLRMWRRTLDTELLDEYIGQWGYVENWLTLYAIVGCSGGIAISKDGELFGRIEAHLPIENSMTADLTNQGGPCDIDIEPGKRRSVYAECGVNMTPITVSVFVETLQFSESPLDEKYAAAFQPQSESTMIGAKFGIAF